MNGNAELLNYIYQNAEMGVETIQQLVEMLPESKFKNQLIFQQKEYHNILETSKKMLQTHGYDEKGIGAFDKLRTYLMINFQTLTDRSTSHIAEMMIIGSNMGIIDAIKHIKQYDDADKGILKLMKQLQSFEENNVEVLKGYL